MAPRGSRSLGLDLQPLLEVGCAEAEGREGVGPNTRRWGHRCWARPLSRPQGDQGLWPPTPHPRRHSFLTLSPPGLEDALAASPPSILMCPFPRHGLLQSIPACQTSWGPQGSWMGQAASDSYSWNSRPSSTLPSHCCSQDKR